MSMKTISPKQLNALVESGTKVDLIDVRTPIEFQEVHVTFAKNVPLDKLDVGQFATKGNGSTNPLYVICRSGGRGIHMRDGLGLGSNAMEPNAQALVVRRHTIRNHSLRQLA